jgi:hypothetical protein
MTTQDPFEAGQHEALRSTDELLDRIGARTPTPEDLDDPVAAALALMAAEIDLDAVPVESTRAALEQALPQRQLGPNLASSAAAREPRRALDLRDDGDPEVVGVGGSHLPHLTAPTGRSRDVDAFRGPRRSGRRPEHAAVAMAPPRSLPRVAARPGHPGAGTRPEGRRPRRLRPLTALVAAVAAIILGSGVTAAVTGGRSVNPLTGLQQVMAELSNGRTVDQQHQYDADLQRIDAARVYARQGNRPEAIRQLTRVATADLPREDRDQILAQVKQVLRLLGDQ